MEEYLDGLQDPPPFDTELLNGPPSTSMSAFEHAKLRQFPRYGHKIEWIECLGNGGHGVVWKASTKFYEFEREEPHETLDGTLRPGAWPLEIEAQNVALLEMMRSAMSCTETDTSQTILIEHKPKQKKEAQENIRSFCDERRKCPLMFKDAKTPPPFPPVPTCHGWTVVQRAEVPEYGCAAAIPRREWLWALVYEVVQAVPENAGFYAEHVDFFEAVGFDMNLYKRDNWIGGRLIDMGDVTNPLHSSWNGFLKRGMVDEGYDVE